MLVLARRQDESVIIDGDIIVTVLEIRGDVVRLGITAPIEVPVHRQEVEERIRRKGRRDDSGDSAPEGQRP